VISVHSAKFKDLKFIPCTALISLKYLINEIFVKFTPLRNFNSFNKLHLEMLSIDLDVRLLQNDNPSTLKQN